MHDPAMIKSNFARNKNDQYFTEHWCTQALHKILKEEDLLQPYIYDPCMGRGDILKAFEDKVDCIQTVGSDIDMSNADNTVTSRRVFEQDFLDPDFHLTDNEKLDFDFGFASIVTNPPYGTTASQILEKALNNVVSVGQVAMLLRSEFKHGKKYTRFFDEHPYAFEIVLTTRPRWDWWFEKGPDEPKASPRHNYSWFVWDAGWYERSTQFFVNKSDVA